MSGLEFSSEGSGTSFLCLDLVPNELTVGSRGTFSKMTVV